MYKTILNIEEYQVLKWTIKDAHIHRNKHI